MVHLSDFFPSLNYQAPSKGILRAALITHELEWLEPWAKLAELELKCSNRELVYVGNTNVTQHLTHIIKIHNCLSRSCLLYNLQCIHSSGVECYSDLCTSSACFKLNKHGNVNKSPTINIYFLIAGMENNYSFGKSERP